MKIELFTVGKLKERWLKEGVEKYRSRICRYAPFAERQFPEAPRTKNSGADKCNRIEAENMLSHIPAHAVVIALTPEGKSFSSERFSSQIAQFEARGISLLILVIGGPDGIDNKLKQRADLLLSLSSMVFPHRLTKVIIMEQLYRAFTIKQGEKYHRE